jgi:hypothetical protein
MAYRFWAKPPFSLKESQDINLYFNPDEAIKAQISSLSPALRAEFFKNIEDCGRVLTHASFDMRKRIGTQIIETCRLYSEKSTVIPTDRSFFISTILTNTGIVYRTFGNWTYPFISAMNIISAYSIAVHGHPSDSFPRLNISPFLKHVAQSLPDDAEHLTSRELHPLLLSMALEVEQDLLEKLPSFWPSFLAQIAQLTIWPMMCGISWLSNYLSSQAEIEKADPRHTSITVEQILSIVLVCACFAGINAKFSHLRIDTEKAKKNHLNDSLVYIAAFKILYQYCEKTPTNSLTAIISNLPPSMLRKIWTFYNRSEFAVPTKSYTHGSLDPEKNGGICSEKYNLLMLLVSEKRDRPLFNDEDFAKLDQDFNHLKTAWDRHDPSQFTQKFTDYLHSYAKSRHDLNSYSFLPQPPLAAAAAQAARARTARLEAAQAARKAQQEKDDARKQRRQQRLTQRTEAEEARIAAEQAQAAQLVAKQAADKIAAERQRGELKKKESERREQSRNNSVYLPPTTATLPMTVLSPIAAAATRSSPPSIVRSSSAILALPSTPAAATASSLSSVVNAWELRQKAATAKPPTPPHDTRKLDKDSGPVSPAESIKPYASNLGKFETLIERYNALRLSNEFLRRYVELQAWNLTTCINAIKSFVETTTIAEGVAKIYVDRHLAWVAKISSLQPIVEQPYYNEPELPILKGIQTAHNDQLAQLVTELRAHPNVDANQTLGLTVKYSQRDQLLNFFSEFYAPPLPELSMVEYCQIQTMLHNLALCLRQINPAFALSQVGTRIILGDADDIDLTLASLITSSEAVMDNPKLSLADAQRFLTQLFPKQNWQQYQEHHQFDKSEGTYKSLTISYAHTPVATQPNYPHIDVVYYLENSFEKFLDQMQGRLFNYSAVSQNLASEAVYINPDGLDDLLAKKFEFIDPRIVEKTCSLIDPTENYNRKLFTYKCWLKAQEPYEKGDVFKLFAAQVFPDFKSQIELGIKLCLKTKSYSQLWERWLQGVAQPMNNILPTITSPYKLTIKLHTGSLTMETARSQLLPILSKAASENKMMCVYILLVLSCINTDNIKQFQFISSYPTWLNVFKSILHIHEAVAQHLATVCENARYSLNLHGTWEIPKSALPLERSLSIYCQQYLAQLRIK